MIEGKVVQVLGSVADVRFPSGQLPRIKEALTVMIKGKPVVMEVAQHCIQLQEYKLLRT